MDNHPARLFPHSLEHLHQLYQTLSTYAPSEVLQRELRADAPPTYEQRDASLLFADVSGFTALSERLAGVGREGAEQVTDAINQYFSAMLEILSEYDGSVLKFGGDALVVAFYQTEHARQATSAALTLQQRMGQWQAKISLGKVPLRLGIGLGSGELLILRLGNRQRREIVLLGTAAEEIAHAEELAAAGEIVVGPTTLSALPPTWVQRQEEAMGWVEPTMSPMPPSARKTRVLPPLSPHLAEVEAQVETLATYLPEGLLERLLLDPSAQLEGEHRMVTVLFVNVVNLPAYPPTDDGRAAILAILQDYFVTMQAIISRFGGAVNKIDVAHEGYKLMALFGAPIAHEDDAVRAVQAALAMQGAIPELNQRASEQLRASVSLDQCIGLNSGIVFAGNVGTNARREYSVMGDHVNLAARIMGQAEPGSILISAETKYFLPATTPLTAVPPVRVKGKLKPVPLFLVGHWDMLRPLAVQQRAPFVGRSKELALMNEALGRAAGGHGQALYLHGEAGIGKSRLSIELLPGTDAFLLLEGRSLAYGFNIPYHPWRPILHTLLAIDINTPPDLQAQAAHEGLARLLPDQLHLFPLLGPILGFDIPHTPTTAQLSPELRQQRLLAVVSDLFQARAAQQPLLLIMDDVQWLDDVSASLLAFIIRQIGETAILVLILGRLHPKEQLVGQGSDLPTLPFFAMLEIQELSRNEGLALAQELLSHRGLSESEQQLILERAGGNPLYIEELAEALANGGSEVPDTLHGLIMSRIDRLSESHRRVLQVASVVGRRFDEPMLCGVYPYSDQQVLEIHTHLNYLTEQRLLDLERPDPFPLYLTD
ncbi:MAG: AAA family ATPase [Ardenticatenales bacterium]|nr:AAA family ATPase [Ardenticatenales bacterium]